jgi:hypothetical protein
MSDQEYLISLVFSLFKNVILFPFLVIHSLQQELHIITRVVPIFITLVSNQQTIAANCLFDQIKQCFESYFIFRLLIGSSNQE